MEGGNANGCNSQEPLPLYKALNEPFHATSRSPNSITNQAWLQAVPVQRSCGFSDTAAEAPFLKIMAQDTGRWVEAVHFFTKQSLSASGLKKNIKYVFFPRVNSPSSPSSPCPLLTDFPGSPSFGEGKSFVHRTGLQRCS